MDSSFQNFCTPFVHIIYHSFLLHIFYHFPALSLIQRRVLFYLLITLLLLFFSFLHNFLILHSLEGSLSPSGTLFRLYRPSDRSAIIFGIYWFALRLLILSFIISQ